MHRYFSIVFFTCLSLLIFFHAPEVSSQENDASLEEQYRQAKFFYKQLESDLELGKKRELWLQGTRNFRRVYLNDPKSDFAPASLYMLGKIYTGMHDRFQLRRDLDESLAYYWDCASLFPQHRLADDALLALGDIYFTNLSQYQTAAHYYTKIVTSYPHGDMHPRASTQLKKLSKKHNISLPKVMIDGTALKKLANVLPVKYWSSKDYSRIIIKASGPVSYTAKLLEKNKDNPRRLYIDFETSYIAPRYRAPIPIADGLLKRIRTGQNTRDTVRVVLDIESISSYKIFSLPDPFRVVIDIRGENRPELGSEKRVDSKRAATPAQIVVLKENKKVHPQWNDTIQERESVETITDDTEFTLAQQLGLGVRKIIIDPGHGGKDPGAMANGLKEKNIVLELSKKLQKKLKESKGYEVELTRTDDTYISLEERTAIANGKNADLFVSIHINAHPASSVSGLETYFLNLANNREAMRVAAFENATSELQMSDLQNVLADIMKNSKIDESSRLARTVQSTLITGLSDSGYNFKDLGVKQAPFYVLIGAEMPAILIEVAFISNPDDAKKLKNDAFLDSFAAKISEGIENYINSNIASLRLE